MLSNLDVISVSGYAVYKNPKMSEILRKEAKN